MRGYSVSVEKEINEEDEKKYSIFRGAGLRIDEKSISSYNKETKPLLLYEFEACPFCRKVREAITILDLDVIFYPCPRGFDFSCLCSFQIFVYHNQIYF